jgi:hypothetical protein
MAEAGSMSSHTAIGRDFLPAVKLVETNRLDTFVAESPLTASIQALAVREYAL